MGSITLYIVVPCYNEQEVLRDTAGTLQKFLSDNRDLLSGRSRILFVDDGSRDGTWSIISALCGENSCFEGLRLSHNRGHQNALWAGMDTAKDKCDCLITIDADLQDDVNAMREFLIKFQSGADIVYGVRKKRDTDSAFKRLTAEGFYKVMAFLGAETVYNHADYRLLSKRAVMELMRYDEVNLYLRGMVPLLGFHSEKVYYERGRRMAGESKYPLRKMLALAFEGATSFSVKPIRFLWKLGLALLLLSLIGGLIDLLSPAFNPGFTAFSVWCACALTLTGLGLVGEYVGKVYQEVKRRPRYGVMEYLQSGEKPEN